MTDLLTMTDWQWLTDNDWLTVTANNLIYHLTAPLCILTGLLLFEQFRPKWYALTCAFAAGKAIIEACKSMTSPDPVPLGNYRGFDMTLSFDTFGKEYRVTLNGALTHEVKLGTDIHGNITRLDNALNGFEEIIRRLENNLDSTKEQLEAANGEADRPFPHEVEYQEKSARLKELNVLLNIYLNFKNESARSEANTSWL